MRVSLPTASSGDGGGCGGYGAGPPEGCATTGGASAPATPIITPSTRHTDRKIEFIGSDRTRIGCVSEHLGLCEKAADDFRLTLLHDSVTYQFVTETWTIAELTAQLAATLTEPITADEVSQSNARIRAVPDERGIRYYTSLGLLDRPTMRGRTALYGRRHLAQLVAIKREQARGATLAEIQRTLPTLDDAALEALAGVALSPRPAPVARVGFWKAPVAAATAIATPASAAAQLATAQLTTATTAQPSTAPTAVRVELELGAGVRLSFAPDRPLTDADVAALAAASAALLAELTRRHLVPVPAQEASHDPDRR